MSNKLAELLAWRDKEAKRSGLEPYLVLGNLALAEIARAKLEKKEDLLGIKGIKDKKFAKYGDKIWEILTTNDGADRATEEIISVGENGEKIFSVSVFLDLINVGLQTYSFKIKGEISGLSVKNGNYYFDLKDKIDGSVLSCVLWKNYYVMFGLELRDGLEVIVSGFPNIYKPNGRFGFRVEGLELVGEGALKKQYDELKAKLEKEGLFASEKKRILPLFPEKIGIITSRQGAVINDFLTNIGRFGFALKFIDVRVEGAQAVPDILSAIKTFRTQDIEILVLMRGGGSLEALQAFNNEAIVRALAGFPKPVVAGIGHDKDVPLAALAADVACSTPSIAAGIISRSWEEGRQKINLYDERVVRSFGRRILLAKNILQNRAEAIKNNFRRLLEYLNAPIGRLREQLAFLTERVRSSQRKIIDLESGLSASFSQALRFFKERLNFQEKTLSQNDPARLLALGFSLAYKDDKIIRGIGDISQGDLIEVRLKDGQIESKVHQVHKVKS